MKKITLLFLSLLLAAGSYAQSVGINSDGSAPDASAMLDVQSSSKGFLAPRMASLPATGSLPDGLIVYINDGLEADMGYYYCKNNVWIKFGAASDATQWTTSGSNIYYNSGNVGIGTATPDNRFEVSGSTFNRIAASVTADVQSGFQIIRTAGTNQVNWEMYTPAGSTNLRIATNLPSVASTDILTFQNNGNVGIGTTSPAGRLHLSTGAEWSNANYGAGLIVDGNRNNAIALLDYSSSNPWAISNAGGVFYLSQMPALGNTTTAPTPRLAISTDGNVGIGTTSPTYPLHVDSYHTIGNQTGYYFSGTTTTITPNTGDWNVGIYSVNSILTNGAFVAFSDLRIKENIKEIPHSLDLVRKLRPVSYNKIDKIENGGRTEFGFIAQEVEKILPEAVNTGTGEIPVLKPFDKVEFEAGVNYTILVKNGDNIVEQKYTTKDPRPEGEIIVKSKTVNDFKSLSYDMIFTVAVDAIREQQTQIEAQQGQLEAQQAQLASQQAQIDALKAQNAVLTQKAESFDQLKAEVENLKKLVQNNLSQLSINQ